MTESNEPGTGLFRRAAQKKILRSELRPLIDLLEASDASMVRFGSEVSRHPAILKQLLRAANSSLTGSSVEITEPAHATIFLGSRRVAFLLNTLPPEMIEEDLRESAAEEHSCPTSRQPELS